MTSFGLVICAAISLLPGKEWTSEPIPVKGGSQYRLSFVARVLGEMVREENAQVALAAWDNQHEARGMRLARWSYGFRDENGKPVPFLRGNPWWRVIDSARKTTYVDGFTVPWNATKVVVSYLNRSKTDTVELELPQVEKIESPYVNVNSDFSLGERCHAGYGIGLLTMEPAPGGGFHLWPQTEIFMDYIPIRPRHNYEFNLKLVPGGKLNGAFLIEYMDSDLKFIKGYGATLQAKADDANGSVDNVISPDGAAFMGIRILGKSLKRLYEHIRITDKGVAK